jgi:preprotein translocase subunit SecA
MILRFVQRAFGFPADRRLARYSRTAKQILAVASEHQSLSPAALLERVQRLREKAMAGTALAELAIPMFALAREAARRTIGEEHVPEQIVGGLALLDGCIVEMKTGEGKTVAATLICALHGLSGRGAHVAIPNDYLARRDATWMRPVYEALGLSVGLVTQQMDDDSRRSTYACDVTYGVASEFGFDYLRDNMKFSPADTVQRGHAFALVDEADAVLIDEAGMPLALFGPLGDQSSFYQLLDSIASALPPDHYEIDDRRRVVLTDKGYDAVEHGLRQASLLKPQVSLHDIEAISLLHHTIQALRAHTLLARDRDYIVQDGAIVIVDKHSGRMMPGRRYDEGLHQALEAKEGCTIGEETRTLASITLQSFFRRYDQLAGMTGTAIGDVDEYRQVYGLDVVAIPTHRPLIRSDDTHLHQTRHGKLRAILDEVERAKARQQPVLIGALSIEHSDELAALLEAHGWKQNGDLSEKSFTVLNARNHANEAKIIALAGLPGAVTIATMMAGRGTDIRLGGTRNDPQLRDRVVAAGGLLVIGTEYHEHRRFDAQLRGRAGRQGDPGRSVFHVSVEDNLLQNPTAAKIARPGYPADPALALDLFTAAQRRIEARSFDSRLSLLRFEEMIQRQRDLIYSQREKIRDDPEPLTTVKGLRDDTIDDLIGQFAPPSGTWDNTGLDAMVRSILTLAVPIASPSHGHAAASALLQKRIGALADAWMQGKIELLGRADLNAILRRIMMAMLDELWTEQSERLEHLKRIIADRRLPRHKILAEFQIEAFTLFEIMMKEFRHEVTAHTMRLGKLQP